VQEVLIFWITDVIKHCFRYRKYCRFTPSNLFLVLSVLMFLPQAEIPFHLMVKTKDTLLIRILNVLFMQVCAA
jgi:hypothetical protein